MWTLMLPALAADLPTTASTAGHAAALDALDALVASTKPKKLARALDAAGLARVEMPVRPFFGAELAIVETGPLTGCAWDGALRCRFTARAEAPIGDGEYAATCRSAMGSRVPVRVRVVEPGTTAVFAVDDARPCWQLGRELLLHPVSDDALEGVGEGDEFAAPELTGLHKAQADAEIQSRSAEFRRCNERSGPRSAGVVVVEYHLDAQGRVDRAAIASSTLGDPTVEACLVGVMRRVRFPPPAGGWEGGTTPFTFQ